MCLASSSTHARSSTLEVREEATSLKGFSGMASLRASFGDLSLDN